MQIRKMWCEGEISGNGGSSVEKVLEMAGIIINGVIVWGGGGVTMGAKWWSDDNFEIIIKFSPIFLKLSTAYQISIPATSIQHILKLHKKSSKIPRELHSSRSYCIKSPSHVSPSNSQLQTLKSRALTCFSQKADRKNATTKFPFSRLRQAIDLSLLSHIHYTIII